MDSDWILSRKIAYHSLTRHFAGWKMRQFVLDPYQLKLEIRTPENSKVTTIQFNSPSIKLGCNSYMSKDNHLLWIRYYDEEDHCPKEVIMKFGMKETFVRWEKNLTSMVERYNSYLQDQSIKYIEALGNLLEEQLHCQSLLQEDLETSAEYYGESWDEDQFEMDMIEHATCDDSNIDYFQNEECPSIVSHESALNEKINEVYGVQDHPTQEKNYRKSLFQSMAVPTMNILIMAVGTRGDIQPFTQLGLRLQQDGHRVRIATHAMFRSYVTDRKLEFFPLAGDPVALSEFMVKTQGFIIPTTPEMLLEAPKHHAMIVEIINSCWGACLFPDPGDELQRPFAADAIISNPVTYAHAHCAEALGIPLHLMFPQPWTPTKAFPHPLSCLSYQRLWTAENYLSYQVIERTMWHSFERDINKLRTSTLGLQPIRTGEGGWNLLNYHKVPFVKMWSPSLVPKPKDWEEHVDVVGTFMEPIPVVNPKLFNSGVDSKQANRTLNRSYDPRIRKMKCEDSMLPIPAVNFEPTSELSEFLNSNEPVIFVGFGSMVVKDLKSIICLFLEAAALANVKILIQVGWSSISPETFMEMAIEAQSKAALIRETEAVNLGESIIFPSTNHQDTSAKSESGAITSREITTKQESESTKSLLGSWFAGALNLGSKLSSSVAESIVHLSQQTSENGMYHENIVRSDSLDQDWDEVQYEGWTAAKDSFFMGPCPHNWLFQKVFAVVHHGGAGTTASGLRFGCPTWICPFFGDQFLWGEMVFRAKLGPRPCPINQLSLPLVVEAFETLKSDQLKQNSLKISTQMAEEDGVEGAVAAFYRNLPLENMLCDVSLFHREHTLAHIYCFDCGLKMTSKISKVIHENPSLHLQDHKIVPCCYFDWTSPPPATATEGIVQGVGSFVHEFMSGVAEAVHDPVKGIYYDGLHGAVNGVVSGLNTLVHHQITGGTLMYEKLKQGVLTAYSQNEENNEQIIKKLNDAQRKPVRVVEHGCSENTLSIRQRRIQISASSNFAPISARQRSESFMSESSRGRINNRSPMFNGNLIYSGKGSRKGIIPNSPVKRNSPYLDVDDMEGLRAPNVLSPIDEEVSPIFCSWKKDADEVVSCKDIPLEVDDASILQYSRTLNGILTIRADPISAPGKDCLLEDLTRSLIHADVRSVDHDDDLDGDSVHTNTFSTADSMMDEQPHGKSFAEGVEDHTLFNAKVLESFSAAKGAHNLFKIAGASNGRFIQERVFMNLIQKAIARSHALMSDEELASSPLHEMESTEKFAILEASLKILARNKKQLDFVNFSSFLVNILNKDN